MIFEITKWCAIVAIALLSLGCSTAPVSWSKKLVFQLRCGMAVGQVEQAIGKKLIDETRGGQVKDSRGTHAVQSEDLRTVVWFSFAENGLQGFRIAWSEATVGFGNMKETPYMQLCSRGRN
jgi:hypothetical protein